MRHARICAVLLLGDVEALLRHGSLNLALLSISLIGSGHRQRPSHYCVRGLSCPLQVFPGGGVMVLSHRERVLLYVLTARVSSSQRVWRQLRVFSS
jgi:hypothetical protein